MTFGMLNINIYIYYPIYWFHNKKIEKEHTHKKTLMKIILF